MQKPSSNKTLPTVARKGPVFAQSPGLTRLAESGLPPWPSFCISTRPYQSPAVVRTRNVFAMPVSRRGEFGPLLQSVSQQETNHAQVRIWNDRWRTMFGIVDHSDAIDESFAAFGEGAIQQRHHAVEFAIRFTEHPNRLGISGVRLSIANRSSSDLQSEICSRLGCFPDQFKQSFHAVSGGTRQADRGRPHYRQRGRQ